MAGRPADGPGDGRALLAALMVVASASGASQRDDDSRGRLQGQAPSPALTRAILVNTASDLAAGANAGGSAPNFNQGWGLLDLASAFDTTVRSYLDQSEVFDSTGDAYERSYTVSDTSKPVRITLVWTDPPGPVFSSTNYVNNLDLQVELGGDTYRGNNLSGGESQPDGNADVANNVEAIVFGAGTSGTFDLDVIATNLAADGVPGVGGPQDQDFALVVSNAAPS